MPVWQVVLVGLLATAAGVSATSCGSDSVGCGGHYDYRASRQSG
jgi:hypothetical protein